MANDDGYDPNSLPDLLPLYYKRLFPYGPYYKWLNYGGVPKTYFTHREFSFTLKDDVYIRYLSFSDQQELERELHKKCPYKIDIGAVFTHKPKEHKAIKATAFQPQEKELVFDIDMTDYDDVRNCCSQANICKKCWPLMVFAVKIIDRALREDFGFDHLLWVYSGRRGIHCWVCDEEARRLSQPARTAVAEYLSLVKGGENQIKKITLPENYIHPSIVKSIEIIRPSFRAYAVKLQDFLGNGIKINKVLQLIPDEEFRKDVADALEKLDDVRQNSSARWTAIIALTEDIKTKGEYRKCHNIVEEIMLQYCYPRLDVNVSTGLNHLLKSPFCVHPKTGRVCVPIDPDDIDNFDPFTVPTISQLCDELNQDGVTTDDKGKKRTKDYRQTSLKGPMQVFDKFLRKLEATWKGKLIEQSDMKREF